MPVSEEVVIQFENHFLSILVNQLEKTTLDPLQSKQITSEYLALYPFSDDQDMKSKLQQFCEKYPDFKLLTIKFMEYEEGKKMNNTLSQMREHMKNNNFDAMLQVAQTFHATK